ncbi:MAG: 16S rRNA (cytidine(1402)-2'-O)-methyltransferase [Rhizobiales bacterium]|nr:16S rRNA (cytidine(1402)-2'-O)-methyltransferase [Hyphomicrobiales bacterium]
MRRNATPPRPGRADPDGVRRRRFGVAGEMVEVPVLESGLYLVATPIGNLRDITLRALDVLAGADVIACEDTRVTRKLLDHYGIATPRTLYHEHNAAQARPRLLARLADGAAVALVSDAGTPLISDPGYKLVRAAQQAGHAVTPVPGASALLAALVASSLPTDRFFFEGFLPAKQAARQSRVGAIAAIPATLVLFETGPRLGAALADLAAGLGARPASVCRELTKLHEEIRIADLVTLAQDYAAAAAPRGEIVIVIAAPDPEARKADDDDLDAKLSAALRRASLKDAVSEVADGTGRPRRAVYQRALALTKGHDDEASG